MNKPTQTGRLPRRFLTPDFTSEPVPDSIWIEGQGFVTNPACASQDWVQTINPLTHVVDFRAWNKLKCCRASKLDT